MFNRKSAAECKWTRFSQLFLDKSAFLSSITYFKFNSNKLSDFLSRLFNLSTLFKYKRSTLKDSINCLVRNQSQQLVKILNNFLFSTHTQNTSFVIETWTCAFHSFSMFIWLFISWFPSRRHSVCLLLWFHRFGGNKQGESEEAEKSFNPVRRDSNKFNCFSSLVLPLLFFVCFSAFVEFNTDDREARKRCVGGDKEFHVWDEKHERIFDGLKIQRRSLNDLTNWIVLPFTKLV